MMQSDATRDAAAAPEPPAADPSAGAGGPPPARTRARPLWAWIAYVAVSVPGLIYGYEFGARLGGMLLGLVVAVNGALFCSIMASAVIEPLMRRTVTPASRKTAGP